MKNVVWLDDNCKIMQNVISQVIRKLWSKNIRSDIFILDEKIKMELANSIEESTIKEINQLILSEFIKFMIAENWTTDDKFSEMYPLINKKGFVGSNSESNYPEATSDVVVKISDIIDKKYEIKNFFDCWLNYNLHISGEVGSIEKDKPEVDVESQKKEAKQFIKSLGLTPQEDIILIDMCLFENDYLRLLNYIKFSEIENALPLFSMLLYKCFSEEKFNVYMYSSYVCPTDLIDKWNQCYKHFYKAETDVEFYNRRGEGVQDRNQNIVDVIIKLCGRIEKNDS